jgi:hypothetical protein
VITKRASSINGDQQLLDTMNGETKKEEEVAAWNTYDATKYVLLHSVRVR